MLTKTYPKVGDQNTAISGSSGAYTNTNPAIWQDVTNLTLTFNSAGRIGSFAFVQDGSGNAASLSDVGTVARFVHFRVLAGASMIWGIERFIRARVSPAELNFECPLVAGTVTYKLQVTNDYVSVNYVKMRITEL